MESVGRGCMRAYVGVVVFGQDVEEAAIDVRLGVVELGDVSVLEPVDERLGAEDEEEGAHDLAGPVGEHSETVGEERAATGSARSS